MHVITQSKIHFDFADPSGLRRVHLANGQAWQEMEASCRTMFFCGSHVRVLEHKGQFFLDVLGAQQVRVRPDDGSRPSRDMLRQFKVTKRKRERKSVGFAVAFQRFVESCKPAEPSPVPCPASTPASNLNRRVCSVPNRLQQRRTKGWRKPPNAVVISRPSKWGNPFKIDPALGIDRPEVVRLFRDWITGDDPRAVQMRREIGELKGKDLLCFCPVPGPCHGDVLLELANR